MNPRIRDISGQTFGRLTVIKIAAKNSGRTKWRCLCSCGKNVSIAGTNLQSGNTTSCGCARVDLNRKTKTIHGMRKTPEFGIWCNMRRRCADPNDKYFHIYGGNGITVCKEWQNSFSKFFSDMGERPSDKHTLDRINSTNGYSPNNCRWATQTEQQNNRRDNKRFPYNGKSMTLRQIVDASKTNISFRTLRSRVFTQRWTLERALREPIRASKKSTS